MENFNKQLENNLLEVIKQKERSDKRLLAAEVFIGITATVILFALVFVAAFVPMADWMRACLIVLGFLVFLPVCFYALRIEQVAGYYACKECGHKYIPTFQAVTAAPHFGRTRHMRCPQCGKKSWQKKVVSKD